MDYACNVEADGGGADGGVWEEGRVTMRPIVSYRCYMIRLMLIGD